jgi:hypothetical protein
VTGHQGEGTLSSIPLGRPNQIKQPTYLHKPFSANRRRLGSGRCPKQVDKTYLLTRHLAAIDYESASNGVVCTI